MVKKNSKIFILLLAIAISMQFAYCANSIVPTTAEKKAVNTIIKQVDGFSETFKLKLLNKFNGGVMSKNDIQLTVHLHKAGLDEAILEKIIENKILKPIYDKYYQISHQLTSIESKLDLSNKQHQDYRHMAEIAINAKENIIKLKDDEIEKLNKDIDSTIKLSNDLASMDNPEAKKALEELQNGNYEYAIKVFDSIIADPVKLEEKKHAKVYFNAAEARSLSNKYQESYKFYLKAVDRDEDNYEYLSQAAWMSMYLIKKEALELLERKLDIEKNKLKNEEKTADTYNTIGRVYDNLGNYEKALEFYNKSLDINLKTIGEIHSETATTYNNIGRVYYALGNYEKALEFYNKSLDITLKTIGEIHSSTAITYDNIGQVYYALGNYEKALEFYNKSLDIKLKTIGEIHSETATTYNNIGIVYKALGNYEKALEFYNKDLNIYLKTIGEIHSETAATYNNIGGVHRALGNYEKALEFYNKDLNICLKTIGEIHSDTAITIWNIGVVYYQAKQYKKACDNIEKAISIFKQTLPANHPHIINAQSWLEGVKKEM